MLFNSNKLKRKTIALALMSVFTTTAYASIENHSSPSVTHIKSAFKIAVIKDTEGTREISKGLYKEGIDVIASNDNISVFAAKMGLCAAKAKVGVFKQAEVECSEAIEALNLDRESNSRTDYLKSIAYSNRGIVRYYLNDKAGAFNDLNQALALDNNSVVMSNLEALNIAILKSEVSSLKTAMDY